MTERYPEELGVDDPECPMTPEEIAEAEAAEDDRKMPPGFAQVDSDLTPEQVRKIRFNMYFFHGIVGVLLLPLALLLRAGRWSMRTLVCHHNGDEFGGF